MKSLLVNFATRPGGRVVIGRHHHARVLNVYSSRVFEPDKLTTCARWPW
jgi:hypothetical protein